MEKGQSKNELENGLENTWTSIDPLLLKEVKKDKEQITNTLLWIDDINTQENLSKIADIDFITPKKIIYSEPVEEKINQVDTHKIARKTIKKISKLWINTQERISRINDIKFGNKEDWISELKNLPNNPDSFGK